jgi:hypothetical protein
MSYGRSYYGDDAHPYAYILRIDGVFLKYLYSDKLLDRGDKLKIVSEYAQEHLIAPWGLSVQKVKEGDDQALI